MGGQSERAGANTSAAGTPMIGAAKKDFVPYIEDSNFDAQAWVDTWVAKPSDIPFSELSDFEANVLDLFNYNAELLISKHKDYGPSNISQAPGGPLNGLRVRIWDKIARINNLIDSGALPEHESLRDSFIDLANYSIIAVMCLDKTWPGVE